MTIKKRITITLPDKPYEATASGSNTVEGWYIGPRYLCVSVTSTGNFYAVELASDSLEETDPANQEDDNRTFLRIDAVEQPLLASLVYPACFSNAEIPDYEEEVAPADGDLPAVKFVHGYSTNVISSLYAGLPTWDGSNWVMPERVSREFQDPTTLIDAIEERAAALESMKEVNDFSDEELATINAYIAFAAKARIRFAGQPAWKITTPSVTVI